MPSGSAIRPPAADISPLPYRAETGRVRTLASSPTAVQFMFVESFLSAPSRAACHRGRGSARPRSPPAPRPPASRCCWPTTTPPHAEFVRLLRESQDASSRFDAGAPAPPTARAAGPRRRRRGDRANAGVRTRSLRPSAPVDVPVTMAVGVAAARSAIERPGQDPLVLAMLSRLDYESLKRQPRAAPRATARSACCCASRPWPTSSR